MLSIGVLDAARTRELRRSVLRPALQLGDPMPGDDVPGAVHLAAVDGPDHATGPVLCTCFVYADPCPWRPGRPAWHLRQMATLPLRRGEGLGAAVVAAAVRHVLDAGAQLLWCHARESAAGFYRRQGFVVHGEVFTDERHTIPHVRMARELAPPLTSS